MELTSAKDGADQSRRIDKYGPATLLAGRQLHAGRSVFFFNMTGGLLGVSLRLRCLRTPRFTGPRVRHGERGCTQGSFG